MNTSPTAQAIAGLHLHSADFGSIKAALLAAAERGSLSAGLPLLLAVALSDVNRARELAEAARAQDCGFPPAVLDAKRRQIMDVAAELARMRSGGHQ